MNVARDARPKFALLMHVSFVGEELCEPSVALPSYEAGLAVAAKRRG